METGEKVVLVTGAAGGIGLACAEAFAGEGYRVMLVDIKETVADAARALSKKPGANAASLVADLSDSDQTRALVDKTISRFGRIDVLVNNAGIIITGDILELAEEDFDKVIDVNLKAYFILGQAAARQMIRQGTPGSIVNMSSVNAVLAIPNQLAYTVSKGGVNQLTRAMAIALAPHNIRVNAIGPGSIQTDVLKAVMTDDEKRRAILARTPIGRIGNPGEVASVAVFLASEAASYVTGQTIYPDGGRSVLNYTVPVPDDAGQK